MDLHRDFQATIDHLPLRPLAAHTKTITNGAKIAQVVVIFVNGDLNFGSLIAQAMEKVDKKGAITVKEDRTIEDKIDISKEIRFDRGFEGGRSLLLRRSMARRCLLVS